MSHLEPEKDALQHSLAEYGLRLAADGYHIQWAVGNPRHPRNWDISRKTYDISLLIFFEFFTTAISTAGSTAANAAAHEFGLSEEFSIFLFVSLYLLGQATGGIILPPYSECFGRKRLYVISALMYSVFCIVIAAVPSIEGVVIGRLVSGFLSAIPSTIVVGSIEDMFNSRDRVWMIWVWALVANLGLVVGPIMGTFTTADLNWYVALGPGTCCVLSFFPRVVLLANWSLRRWLFWIAAIVTGALTLLLLGIRESRPALLLEREVAQLRKMTNMDCLVSSNPDSVPNLRTFTRVALGRPIKLFFTELIVFTVSVMTAVATALVYLFTQALPPIYRSFGFTSKQACLPFIAIGAGLSLGLLTRYLDMHLIERRRRNGHILLPEHKLAGFWIGSGVLAGALWLFAWTIPPAVQNLHWAVSVLALVLIGYALNEIDYVLGGYLADSYLSYAASGLAALSLVRALLSGILPLVSSSMFDQLGANVAVSLLAGVATAFCLVPPLFSRFGETIRARSKFAKYSLDMYHEHSVDEDGY
ncbi:major facilitator superfamily domain-containing protein [Aspergillus egyptiacus]|nr:major facilitator superfamily domain-containing protein [Aspergillus egyptiacus]